MEELTPIEKILVPVDYSEYSLQACQYALKIAQKTGASVDLFHAFYSPAFDLIELTGNKSVQKKLRDDVTGKLIISEQKKLSHLEKVVKAYPEAQRISPDRLSFVTRPGLANEEILNFSIETEPDLVVMGTRGADKRENSLLGSSTEFAIKKLKCPVLAVPEHFKILQENAPNRIVYLTNFDESDFLSIRMLLGFTQTMSMTIHCLHVGTKKDKWEEIKMNGLKEYFKTAYNNTFVECDVLTPEVDVLQAIAAYITEKNITLLSLTRRKRNFFEKYFKPDLTRKLFYNSNIPLLVFHS